MFALIVDCQLERTCYDIFELQLREFQSCKYAHPSHVFFRARDTNQDNENKKKKKLIIISSSNSSKRRSNSVKMLRKLGFNENDFDEIITSGEVAHH